MRESSYAGAHAASHHGRFTGVVASVRVGMCECCERKIRRLWHDAVSRRAETQIWQHASDMWVAGGGRCDTLQPPGKERQEAQAMPIQLSVWGSDRSDTREVRRKKEKRRKQHLESATKGCTQLLLLSSYSRAKFCFVLFTLWSCGVLLPASSTLDLNTLVVSQMDGGIDG